MEELITRAQAIIQTLSNYLESGVITPVAIAKTSETLANLCDQDLTRYLVESHILREMVYSTEAFRNTN